jgi:sugar phosphate isomerase/epimerase
MVNKEEHAMDISITVGSFTGRFGLEEGCKIVSEAGYESVDWSLAVWNSGTLKQTKGQAPENIFDKDMDEIWEYFQPALNMYKKYGLRLGQAHAPFNAWDSQNPDLLDYAIEVYKKNILLCDKAGCKYLVLHGIKPYRLDVPDDLPGYEEAERLNRKLFESLIPTLLETDVVVCMENLFSGAHNYFIGSHCSDPDDAVAFIDELNAKAGKECFGLCYDTGHLFLSRVEPKKYIRKLGKRIKVLHMDDNWGVEDSHRMPFAGMVPWMDICDALHEIGYEGNINFETGASFSKANLPEELVPEFAIHNFEIGKYFRKVIQG